jgi:hypothetical protein
VPNYTVRSLIESGSPWFREERNMPGLAADRKILATVSA